MASRTALATSMGPRAQPAANCPAEGCSEIRNPYLSVARLALAADGARVAINYARSDAAAAIDR